MLAMLVVTVSLCGLSIYAIAKAAQTVMSRLGLDLMAVLLWLGLAERPAGARPPRPFP